MASRSRNHHNRHDDPYVFDDPYRHSNSPINDTAYEYVGTDEATNASKSHRGTSPDPEPRRRQSPSRRNSRTTSPPPRYSERDRAHTLPSKPDRRSSPHRTSRHASPPRTGRKASRSKHREDQGFLQRPGVQRTKSIGQKGLKFISEAAALYAATQAGSGDRGRSQSRDNPRRSSHYDSEPRHRHHHRHHSPTPSPSPHRRRSRAYSDDPPRRHRRHRSPSVSDESDYERDRGRRHRRSRASSYTQSPSPSPPRHRGRKSKSASSGVGSSKVPNEIADRWQMAARAALEAGGLTAFRLRKDPGSWTGEKGAKIATAALGAAAIDAFIDKDPRRAKSKGVKGFAETTISSMIASKLMGVKSPGKRKGK
ncbi:uncharacterized protein F4817DRAFT_123789 [Daldinia loculata]|uniref:uncharacterized protein n=1 Tax=Daldinia loculata TaxID=103429 RepID=UPI0020C38B3B|nr:uncharacterized protein F4817DRAFT_123789 [Daldinia loculata]KAI1646784.1 hypothetical protein F4817DRAFT_123789 [Daldinia loculata]